VARRSDPGFKVIVALTDKFTAPIKGINNQIAQSTAKLRGMMAIPGAIARETGLTKIGSAVGNVGTAVGKLRTSLAGVLGPFARIGAIIGGISIGKLVADWVTLGGTLIKVSAQTGVSVEELQKLRYAAEQSGLSAEDMDSALVKLNKSIVAAKRSGKETTGAFKAAGITLKDLKSLTPDEIFRKLASAVANTSDESHKQALAFDILGKSGTEFLAVLNEGAWGLREFGDELAATGAIMTQDLAKSSKEFGDIMTRTMQHVRGLALGILKQLLPGLKGGATAMDEWIKANKEWLTQKVVGVVKDLVEMGTAFVNIVRNDILPGLARLRPVWDGLVSVIGEGNALLLTFTAVVAPGVLGAILGIGKALAGLALALAANPIGAAIIGLVAITAYAGYQIYKNWDSITQQTKDTGAAIGKTFSEVKDRIAALQWSDITDTFSGLWRDVQASTAATGARLSQTFSETRDIISAGWASFKTDAGTWMSDIGAVIAGAAGGLRDIIVGALTAPIESVKQRWNELVGWLIGIWDRIKGIFGGASSLPGGAALAGAGGGGEAPAPVMTAAPYMTPAQRRAALVASRSAAPGPESLGEAAQQTSRTEVDINVHGLQPGDSAEVRRSTGNADVNLRSDAAYAGPRGAIAGAY
jgi:hypothetical protein